MMTQDWVQDDGVPQSSLIILRSSPHTAFEVLDTFVLIEDEDYLA